MGADQIVSFPKHDDFVLMGLALGLQLPSLDYKCVMMMVVMIRQHPCTDVQLWAMAESLPERLSRVEGSSAYLADYPAHRGALF